MRNYVYSPVAAWGRTLPWGPHSVRPKGCALEVINKDVAVFTCKESDYLFVITKVSTEQLRVAQTTLPVNALRRTIERTGSYLGNPEWYMPLQVGWARKLHKELQLEKGAFSRA